MIVHRAAALFVASAIVVTLAAQEPEKASSEARRREAQQRALDQVSAVVKGRCVDGASGEPLVGCKVAVHAWGGRRDGDLPQELLRPEAVTTGADGSFTIRVLAREDYQVGFDASLDGRWPRTGRWHHLLPGEVEDVGDVKLYPGVRLVGRVVDEQGQPLPSITVGIDELPLFLGSETAAPRQRAGGLRFAPKDADAGRTRAMHWAANGVRWAHSGEDGAFTSREALPAGTFELRINNSEVALVEPKQITVPAEGPMQPVTIVVRQEPYIGGIVVDDTGAPVKGVGLQAELHRSGRMASARTRADGTFRIYRVEDCPEKVRIQIDDPGPCERPAPTDEVAWGTHDLRIELQRALTVELQVVVAGSGAPVEDFAVRCYPTGGGMMSSLDQRLRLSGVHEGGKLLLDGVKRGAGRIGVVPKDPTLRCVEFDVDGKPGMAPLRVELERLVPMMVLVLDEKGLPLPKAAVLAIEPGNQPQHRAVVDPRSDGLSAFSTDPTARFDELLHKATTDGGGQCIVYGIDGRDDLVLVVRVDTEDKKRVEGVSFGARHASRQIQLDAK